MTNSIADCNNDNDNYHDDRSDEDDDDHNNKNNINNDDDDILTCLPNIMLYLIVSLGILPVEKWLPLLLC